MLTNSPEETFEPVSSARRRTWQFGKQQVPHAIFTAADGSLRPAVFFRSPAFLGLGGILRRRASALPFPLPVRWVHQLFYSI